MTTANHQSRGPMEGLFSAPIQFSQSEATFSVLTWKPAASNCEIIECEPSSSTMKDPSLEIKTLFDSQHWPVFHFSLPSVTGSDSPGPPCSHVLCEDTWARALLCLHTRIVRKNLRMTTLNCLMMSGTAASCRLKTLQCCRHCDPSSSVCVMT